MFARIHKELETKTLSKALNAVIDDANNLLHNEEYFAAFDLYESVYRFLFDYNFENTFSNNIANELLWCKSAMETCKRFASTISSDEALVSIEALNQDLNKYAPKLNKTKKRTIEGVLKTAKAYYDDKISRANANYLYAHNIKECLDVSSKNPDIVSIKKLVLLNTENRVTISLIRKTIQALSDTCAAYH